MKPLEFTYEPYCTSCGAKLKKQQLSFSELDLKPYHKVMTECNPKHPNSYVNHSKRNGKLIEMLTIKEAQEEYRRLRAENLGLREPKRVTDLLRNPTSIRVDTVENAAYIVQLSEEREMTIAETLRWIVGHSREHTDLKLVTDQPEREVAATPAYVPEPDEEEEQQVEEFEVPATPEPQTAEDDLDTF